MVSEYEASKLQQDVKRERRGSGYAVTTCSACIAILSLIALIGVHTADHGGSTAPAVAGEATAGYELKAPLDRP